MGGHFSARIGGAQYQAKCIVEKLKEDGRFEIFYLARNIDPEYEPEGYQIFQIADPVGLRKRSFALDSLRLLRLLKNIRPDIVYQRGLKAHTGLVAMYTKKKSQSRSVFHIAHDDNVDTSAGGGPSKFDLLGKIDRAMSVYGLKKVDQIIAQSRYQASMLQINFGRKAAAVVPNFHPFPSEEVVKKASPIVVIWVANFKADKRPEVFVRLAEDLLENKNIQFVMIGRPGSDEKYADLHARIERLPNLEYLGETPIEVVNKRLASGHIFVNTSRAEGFPNTFVQAWMRKVPTLSVSVNPDEILTDGKIGFFSGSYERLRGDILRLVNDEALRISMGNEAQRYAFEVHSPNAANKLIDILFGASDV